MNSAIAELESALKIRKIQSTLRNGKLLNVHAGEHYFEHIFNAEELGDLDAELQPIILKFLKDTEKKHFELGVELRQQEDLKDCMATFVATGGDIEED